MKKLLFAIVLMVGIFFSPAFATQNVSVSSLAELADLYTGGGTTYDPLANNDMCFVFLGDADRITRLYVYDIDSAVVEDGDHYIAPDEVSAGVPYAGAARWVLMSLYVNEIQSAPSTLQAGGWEGLEKGGADSFIFQVPDAIASDRVYKYIDTDPAAGGQTHLWTITGSTILQSWITPVRVDVAQTWTATQTVNPGRFDFSLGYLDLPHGNNPTVSQIGQIAWDENGFWLRAYDGTNTVAVARRQEEINVTIPTPNNLAAALRDMYIIWSNESGMTFTVTGWKAWSGTDDTDLNIEEYNADGTGNATVDAVSITTNGTGVFTAADTTITGPTIENGHILALDFDDVDTPTYVKLTIYGYYNGAVN
jgi:hypothetical protein